MTGLFDDAGEPDDLSALFARAEADADRAGTDALDPEIASARRRRRRRRRLAAAIVTLVVVAGVGTYIPVTLLAPAASAAVAVNEPDVAQPAAATLVLPDIGASAVSVMGADEFPGTEGTGGILASSGGTDPRSIASITKLVTALVILDAKPLGPSDAGPTITFSEADEDLYDKYYLMDATVQPMRAGSSMSERDALETMLVVSATNYAEAVSTWAFGSQANFRRAAKAWLGANGLTGTTIVEPTGIDARNLSTTVDLVALGKMALANPVVAAIVRTPSLDVPGLDPLPNSNHLLGVDGVNGIKTGTLEEAGACLLFSAVLNVGMSSPITVVGVVLGGQNHNAVDDAARALLDSITSGFHVVPLLTRGDELGTYTTPWGDDAVIVADADASLLTWSDTPVTSTIDTKKVTTGASGSHIGTATFAAGPATVTVPLVLKGAIEGPDAWWRFTHPAELLG